MRLIDLRCDWALQYAAESTEYEAADYAEISPRVPRLDGYLMGASLAVLACRRAPADWGRQVAPWRVLGEMVARHEAEFSGRLLARPDDVARWRGEPKRGLCWGVLAVGLDGLLRSADDLGRIPGLFARGVRIFAAAPAGLVVPLSERLHDLAPAGEGPRPILDLAGSDAAAVAEALGWFEADAGRVDRVLLLHSAVAPGDVTPEISRLRALGGVVGVNPEGSVEAFRAVVEALAALPFRGKAGYEGIGVATDYLRVEAVPHELADVDRLNAWVAAHFPANASPLLLAENARRLLRASAGVAGAPRAAEADRP